MEKGRLKITHIMVSNADVTVKMAYKLDAKGNLENPLRRTQGRSLKKKQGSDGDVNPRLDIPADSLPVVFSHEVMNPVPDICDDEALPSYLVQDLFDPLDDSPKCFFGSNEVSK
jgi:hypothetical protein